MIESDERGRGTPLNLPADATLSLPQLLRDHSADRTDLTSSELAALRRGIHEDIQSSTKARFSNLQERPTWMRRALAFLTFGTLIFLGWSFAASPSFSKLPLWYVAITTGSLFIVGAGALIIALRPSYAAPLGTGMFVAVLACALGATLISTLASAAVGAPLGLAVTKGAHLSCATMGVVMGVPTYVAARLLDRNDGTHSTAILAAVGAGISGHLISLVHCPVHSFEHGMIGHFSIVLGYIMIALALIYLGRAAATEN